MTFAKILIVIVTWNKEEYVLNLLESIGSLVYQKDCIDILLIDNASQDNTVQNVSEKFPDVAIIRNESNLGGTGGFNTGLKWASEQPQGKYDYLWLLDNDVVVNQRALIELVDLLENNSDAAIAGSSMMQLDYPWRVNEVGSYYSRATGSLVLNYHGFAIEQWKGRPVEELLTTELDLADYIPDFNSYIDVDYVAAASLLVRAEVAREAGLWDDFFIHFDDVEWCLRIARRGYRVLASCRSLIWHMSAAAKVPTWVLYYDSRNLLKVMSQYTHAGENNHAAVNHELKRAVYYALIGRMELAQLFIMAVDDYSNDSLGKREIQLPPMESHLTQELNDLPFMDPEIRTVLVSWNVNLYSTGLQELLVKASKKRPDLKIDFLTMPGGFEKHQMPSADFIPFPVKRIFGYLKYWQMRKRYDLVIQSEYQRVIGLSWIGGKIMFVSNTEYCLRPPTDLKRFVGFCIKSVLKRWRMSGFKGKIRSLFLR